MPTETTIKLYPGYSGKAVGLYSKPLNEAMAKDRVCRFERTKETERLVAAMAGSLDLLAFAEKVVKITTEEVGNPGLMLRVLGDEARAVVAQATPIRIRSGIKGVS